MKDSEEWQIFNNGEGLVALHNPKTDKILKISLAVCQAVGKIGNSLSKWCSLLITTFDMLIEVASGFIHAQTSYIMYDLELHQVSYEWRKEKRTTWVFRTKFILNNTALDYDCWWTLEMGIDGGSPGFHLCHC